MPVNAREHREVNPASSQSMAEPGVPPVQPDAPAGASVHVSTRAERRGIMLHDGVSFLALSAICIALYVLTWFLFRSFESHRYDLSVRWAERGKSSLAANRPKDAIYALRTALSYAPDNHDDQLLLAEALARAGHTDEASNYFLNLWTQTPGDGFINLQLARLTRSKGDVQQATNYYRAAIFGNWEGDAPVRRRDTRLELADFLVDTHELTAARAELFIAAANNPQDAGLALAVADRLERTGDLNDALVYDQKATVLQPRNRLALATAGHVAYTLGDFAEARRLFERAANSPAPAGQDPKADEIEKASFATSAQLARRALELSLSRDLPQAERLDHLLAASAIAQARLKACVVELNPVQPAAAKQLPGARPPAAIQAANAGAPGSSLPLPLASLTARWTAAQTAAARKLLGQNADAQDGRVQLIYDTEDTTTSLCGRPVGDDMILTKLAQLARQHASALAQAAHGR